MRLAVFGSPVGHSLSPAMHRAALEQAGIGGVYVARDVDPDGFREGVAEIRMGALQGANVTMPHKALAYSMCDVLGPEAERAGAVNTLSLAGSDLVGDNTDVIGIRSAWEHTGIPTGVHINILGAGSAAAAALLALKGNSLSVVARRPERAEAVVERTGVSAVPVAWGEPLRPGVLVNATSLGMRGERLPDDLLESALGLFDMAYGSNPTPAVAWAIRTGIPVAAGLDMLVGQAVVSFKVWTGIVIDPVVMRTAAEDEIARRMA